MRTITFDGRIDVLKDSDMGKRLLDANNNNTSIAVSVKDSFLIDAQVDFIEFRKYGGYDHLIATLSFDLILV